MTPAEMSSAMIAASGGSMWINPVLWFQDRVAYYHIATGRTAYPTIRLCAVGDSLHWTLAYGEFILEQLLLSPDRQWSPRWCAQYGLIYTGRLVESVA